MVSQSPVRGDGRFQESETETPPLPPNAPTRADGRTFVPEEGVKGGIPEPAGGPSGRGDDKLFNLPGEPRSALQQAQAGSPGIMPPISPASGMSGGSAMRPPAMPSMPSTPSMPATPTTPAGLPTPATAANDLSQGFTKGLAAAANPLPPSVPTPQTPASAPPPTSLPHLSASAPPPAAASTPFPATRRRPLRQHHRAHPDR